MEKLAATTALELIEGQRRFDNPAQGQAQQQMRIGQSGNGLHRRVHVFAAGKLQGPLFQHPGLHRHGFHPNLARIQGHQGAVARSVLTEAFAFGRAGITSPDATALLQVFIAVVMTESDVIQPPVFEPRQGERQIFFAIVPLRAALAGAMQQPDMQPLPRAALHAAESLIGDRGAVGKTIEINLLPASSDGQRFFDLGRIQQHRPGETAAPVDGFAGHQVVVGAREQHRQNAPIDQTLQPGLDPANGLAAGPW